LIWFDFAILRVTFYGFLRSETSVLNPTQFVAAIARFRFLPGNSIFNFSFFMRRVYAGHMDIRCPCEKILKIFYKREFVQRTRAGMPQAQNFPE
jgi:hypothetical protein